MRFLYILLLLLSVSLYGQDFPEPMNPPRLVNDFTGLLDEQQQIELNNKLLNFNNQTSTQIYVVTYDDLQGFDINDYGARLGEKWGIGQQGKDNGILVLVSPANRTISIQTGYGLEGAVPDALAKRVIETVITPGFREGNYYAGLDSATNVLMSLTKGEYTAEEYMKRGGESFIPFIIIFGLFMLFIFSGLSNAKKRFYSPKHSIPWWLLMNSGTNRGSWGSFSSGSGSFGGFGGGSGGGFGGFGGGGGGGFGGGGASGGW